MTALATTNGEWVISKNHRNIFHVRDDRERFNDLTRGKVVVYGINTLETLPNKKPLVGRKNIILTHNRNVRIEGATMVGNLEELRYVLKSYDTDDIYLIGGAQTFSQLIDDCKTAVLTVVDDETGGNPEEYEYFPDLSQRPNWIPGKTSSDHFCEGHCWRYVTYTNLRFRKHGQK